MANDKLKHGDDPPGSTSPLQWLKESEIPVKNNEVSNFMGTLNSNNASGVDDITMPCTTTPFPLFPFGDMYGTTNPYAMEMPLTGTNLMTDLTAFSNSQNPFFDYDSVYVEGHTPVLPSPVSNFLGLEGNKTEFSQCHILDYSVPPDNAVSATSNVNIIEKSYVDRKLVTAKGNSAAALESIQWIEELNGNTGRPQLLRNFISDGVSTPVPCHAIDGVDIALTNNFMTSEVQEYCPEKFDANLLTLGIGQKTEDLSKFNRSGINVTNNFGRVALPQPNTFYGRKEDKSSLNPSSDVAAGLPCLQNNVGGFDVMKNNMPQDDDQHHFLMPGNRNVSLGVEGNWDTRSAYIDPNNSFQYSPAVSIIPVGSSLAELPDSGWSRANGLTLSPSSSTSTCLPVSETSRNLFSDSSMVFPPIGVTRSTSLHDEFGKLSTANQGIAAQVAERGHVPGKLWFGQLPSNSCQPQVIGAVQSSTDLSRSVMTGEEIPITKLNRTVQGSSALVGTSLKRVAEEPPAAASRAQLKKRRAQSSGGLFAPNLFLHVPSLHLPNASNLTVPAPTAPSLPHQVKSTASLPPLPQTSRSLPLQAKGTASLPPISENAPSLPPQEKGAPLFTPPSLTTSSLPTLLRCTAVLPPLSQIAPSLPSQAKTTASHQPLPQTAPYLRPKGSTTSLPSLSQNAPFLPSMPQIVPLVPSEAKTTQSHPPLPQAAPNLISKSRSITSLPTLSQNAPFLTPLPRIAPPLSSQPSSAPPLPQKIWTAKPLPEKSQTASPLPAKSQTASPLHLSPQIAPPLPSKPQTASTFHIKWQGFGQTQSQPIGHKCLICKRDLSFTPEGPVFVPTIRPVVAVLPCGHTFHDHCLRLITPGEQVKNPPCIPCAIGES